MSDEFKRAQAARDIIWKAVEDDERVYGIGIGMPNAGEVCGVIVMMTEGNITLPEVDVPVEIRVEPERPVLQ